VIPSFSFASSSSVFAWAFRPSDFFRISAFGFRISGSAGLLCSLALSVLGAPSELRVGVAGHAFDHLGAIGDQAQAAAASGATIIYVTGCGGLGYQGLPRSEDLDSQRQTTSKYLRDAKRHGIRLAIGYVCATSIVKLDSFDRNWPPGFRARFHAPPSEWRQQDRNGKPLPSWYGGDYQPACMNHPDWRAYEKFIVCQQLESGCDGIFFDNPTVHPQGCYCPHCMENFARFLQRGLLLSTPDPRPPTLPLAALRDLAASHPAEFLRFRCTIARDFLAEMRSYARTIKRGALVTANNSLNSAEALFSQCRSYAYNIYELSQAEDLVVVEDMASQPRLLPNGQTLEYGPTYKQLRALSHGKPVVAVTIAEADYHTAPHLVRLAMAEAAANGASYLSWPTWPEKERSRMISTVRPQADFLRRNAKYLNDAPPRRDVLLFLPFRRWTETDHCAASTLAAALTRANVQYEVICEDDLNQRSLRRTKVLFAASPSDFTATEQRTLDQFSRSGGAIVTAGHTDWLKELQTKVGTPSIRLQGPPTLRVIVNDQPRRTLVHLLNLDLQRLSSFDDRLTPATDVQLTVRVPFPRVRSVRALTADTAGTSGPLTFSSRPDVRGMEVELTLPRVEIAELLVIE
jgi:hypothetical protein